MTWIFAVLMIGLWQTPEPEPTVLDIQLWDAAGQPAAGQTVLLELYVFDPLPDGQAQPVIWHRQECVSDATGACALWIPRPPRDDLLRGAVWISTARRDVIWPGGRLYLPLRLDQLDDGRHDQPFDFDHLGSGTQEPVRAHVTLWWALGVGVLLTALTLFLAAQSRRQL